ncbi:MAG: helix-turn-helix domain-containing protein [bacterium]|nr:helix-turn-helix domain-containing protein [bacterium]
MAKKNDLDLGVQAEKLGVMVTATVLEFVEELLEQKAGSVAAAGLLDEKEAADYLKIAIYKLRDMRKAGEIPFVPFGREARYHLPTLEEWIQNRIKHDEPGYLRRAS